MREVDAQAGVDHGDDGGPLVSAGGFDDDASERIDLEERDKVVVALRRVGEPLAFAQRMDRDVKAVLADVDSRGVLWRGI